ncbi:Cinorf13 protein [Pseudonocardia sp. Ae717_Ps2]|nr:Cinorf13 protein [Pseudonocardia sp. Ae717_Ps2]
MTQPPGGTLSGRLRFLSSTVLRLDRRSRGLADDSLWPDPEARRVLDQAAAGSNLVLTNEQAVRVAVGIGIPADSLTAPAERWSLVESCFRRLMALRAHDERWLATLLESDEITFPSSSSRKEVHDMNMAFWSVPRCYRGPWPRLSQARINSRRHGATRNAPNSATEHLSDVDVLERCSSMIAALNESIGPFDGSIREYLTRLEAHRGRPIRVRTFLFRELKESECGIFIPRRTYDEIGFPLDAPHATHIILHEVGHMVFDHAEARNPEESPLFRSMASIAPEALAVYLGRSVYECRSEREAEAFASLLSAESATSRSRPKKPAAVNDSVALRIRGTFGG